MTRGAVGEETGWLAAPLLAWYDRRQRDLPWRREVSAYRTLVSEFMLQQTVVAAAIPFFQRFLARFPDLATLAAAPEEQVLAAWSGLGYYARARNLHRAARAVVERHEGELPDQEETLRQLPGIGPYTAAAVAAIAFGRPTFALDGNAVRVVARLTGTTAPIDRTATRDGLRAVGQGWVPAARPGDFAQAVMELGATVCLPRSPSCGQCPVAERCQARRQGSTAGIPAKSPRPAKRVVRVASVRLRRQGLVLLVRRPRGLLAGTWTLPGRELADGAPAGAAARAVLRDLGLATSRVTPVGSVRHLFTHRDVTVEVFDAGAGRRGPGAAAEQAAALGAAHEGRQERHEERWIDERRLHEVAVSTFVRKQLALKGDKVGKAP